jgi:VWFA-related protein
MHGKLRSGFRRGGVPLALGAPLAKGLEMAPSLDPTAASRGRLFRIAALGVLLATAAGPLAGDAPGSGDRPPAPLPVELETRFSPTQGIRSLLQALVRVPAAQATANQYGYYNLAIAGEVRIDGRPYDRFTYRFDVPAGGGSQAPLALAFDRTLRPGSFVLVVRVEDLQSGRIGNIERPIVVPDFAAPAGDAPGAGSTLLSGEVLANGVLGPELGEVAAIRLVRPPAVVVGKHRFEAIVRSQRVTEVTSLLDGKPVMTRVQPPFLVELDLGRRPALQTLRVEARGAGGELLGQDQAELNAGGVERFAVRLAPPPAAAQRRGHITATAEVQAPHGQVVSRVELFLDDQRVAVLLRPPFVREVTLGGPQPAVLRAVAYLDDGAAAEDSVLLNSPHGTEVDVNLVELYAAVVDRRGQPVTGLPATRFRVVEEGRPQRLERFEEVRDLPLHVALLLDTSGSMNVRLPKVREAALDFLRHIVTPKDRVTLITFDSTPRMRTGFTNDMAFLANGLEALRAGGGTALYDRVVFALEQFEGVSGQRAIVLLSDGLDENSSSTAAEVMELARRSAATIYTIGLEEWDQQAPAIDRALLTSLAEETGGRAFFAGRPEALTDAYGEIEREVRSRYLLSYYSTQAADQTSFRLVNVEVVEPKLSARTIRGYYP